MEAAPTQCEAEGQGWQTGTDERFRGVHDFGIRERSRQPEVRACWRLSGEEMAQLFFLSLEIFLGVRAGSDFAGDAFDDFALRRVSRAFTLSGLFESRRTRVTPSALRISAGRAEVAVVVLEAEALVGFDGVESGILQFVGLQLGHQADAAALLLLVDENARAFLGDHRERKFQLLAAIAAQGMKDVSGQALRVNANQGRGGFHVAHHQGDGFFDATIAVGTGLSAKAVDAELAPAGGKIRGSDLLDFRLTHCIHYSGWACCDERAGRRSRDR